LLGRLLRRSRTAGPLVESQHDASSASCRSRPLLCSGCSGGGPRRAARRLDRGGTTRTGAPDGPSCSRPDRLGRLRDPKPRRRRAMRRGGRRRRSGRMAPGARIRRSSSPCPNGRQGASTGALGRSSTSVGAAASAERPPGDRRLSRSRSRPR
jgi:hypothetical protein